ncbi:MAG TPA: Asp-tRNA(Asn)/Glu-tRNA(Gln) amidotransferase subunit GatA, partial [Candidatus Nanoarchaeia archaeon]|nr:Asp-tRNA(Asn)/Glu-tRNA(Gln) amidotransferase subunit GatA [Candidatus Nanoarchaeia archaeon]
MSDLTRPISELTASISEGRLKAVELVQQSLGAIKASGEFNAVLEVSPAALDRAKQVDAGKLTGRLAGIPFIAKDNFLTFETHTTASSNILKPFHAPYQSTAIDKLEAEGAILVAKANLDAFAHGSSTENSDFGPTRNPWDKDRVPGGSSGGSAAAVALGLASFALGTDTGGSIRLPASFCGVVGLKPTYGLVSRNGVIAMASSTDVIGPLTRTVEDAALVLDIMAGRDPLDATTIERGDNYSHLAGDLSGLKIGIIKEYMGEGIGEDVKANTLSIIDRLKSSGAHVEEVSLPSVELALACYYIIVPAEISSNLARYDGIKYGFSAPEAKTLAETYALTRDQGFGDEAKRRIMIGTYVLSSGYYDAYYKKAQQVRTLLIQEFEKAFQKYDLLVGPTSPTTAFKLGSKSHDPISMYLTDVMTVATNLVGNCAISIPSGKDSAGLPIGFQLIGPQKG